MYKISLLLFLPLLASENSRPSSGFSRFFSRISRSNSVSITPSSVPSPSPASSGRTTPAHFANITRKQNSDGSITVIIDGAPVTVSRETTAAISSRTQTPSRVAEIPQEASVVERPSTEYTHEEVSFSFGSRN